MTKSKSSLEKSRESVSDKRRTSKKDIFTKESRKKWIFTKKGLVMKKKML